MKTPRLAFKTLALATALSLSPSPHAESMKDVFDAINITSNVSSPAVLQGQTMNLYSGGSMFMRMPSRTYNLVQFSPPSWSAGCGGIDLYMGGFSHINKNQFVAMLKSIGSNAMGYAFKLAIQNLCPTCDNVMQALQSTANAINRLNIDSCEAAKGIVNASKPDAWTKGVQQSAINAGTFTNYFSDVTDAWTQVMGSQAKGNQAVEAAISTNPNLTDEMPRGNIVWKALRKQAHLGSSPSDLQYQMFLMSLVGTVVFDTTTTGKPRTFPATDITVETLIGAKSSSKSIPITYYDCGGDTSADGCLNPTPQVVTQMSFSGLVRDKMEAISTAIAGRTPHANVPDVVAFLNATDFPVYKMLSITTSLGNTGLADTLIGRYKDLIAAKYAQTYLDRAAKDLRTAIKHYRSNAPTVVDDELKEVDAAIDKIVLDARSTLANVYAQTLTTYRVAEELQHIERALSTQMSQTLKQSLAFSKAVR